MKKLPSLNGLRAISIIIVIISHFEYKHYFAFHNIFSPNSLALLSDGQFGVNVFFVISGFIITSLLLAEEKKHPVNLKNFYIRRSLRIFPAYFFLLFVYYLLELSGIIEIPRTSWITSLTYTKDFFIGEDWYTGHFWSLSMEEHFYLFWPFLFLYKRTRSISPWVLIAIPVIFRFPVSYFYPNRLSIHDLNIVMRIDSIAIGCLFAIHKDRILSRIQSRWNTIVFVSVIVLMSLAYIQHNLPNNHFVVTIHNVLGTPHGVIANFAIAFIMFYSVFGPKNWWYSFLNTKAMNFIGVLSYSLYLWQELFIYDTQLFINKLPFNLIFLFGAALFSYYLVEKPFLKLKSKY